jgi:hypothetical protein
MWVMPYGEENPKGYKAILHNLGFQNISIHVETVAFVSPNTTMRWRQMKQAAQECFEKMPELDRLTEQVFIDLMQFQFRHGIRFYKTAGFAFGTKL